MFSAAPEPHEALKSTVAISRIPTDFLSILIVMITSFSDFFFMVFTIPFFYAIIIIPHKFRTFLSYSE